MQHFFFYGYIFFPRTWLSTSKEEQISSNKKLIKKYGSKRFMARIRVTQLLPLCGGYQRLNRYDKFPRSYPKTGERVNEKRVKNRIKGYTHERGYWFQFSDLFAGLGKDSKAAYKVVEQTSTRETRGLGLVGYRVDGICMQSGTWEPRALPLLSLLELGSRRDDDDPSLLPDSSSSFSSYSSSSFLASSSFEFALSSGIQKSFTLSPTKWFASMSTLLLPMTILPPPTTSSPRFCSFR